MSENKSALTFITESLPSFFVGEFTTFDIEASGGTLPYSFTITEGALPNGLNMSAQGTISGTPTEMETSTVWVKLTDAAGAHLTQAFEVQVVAEEQGTDTASRSTSAN